MFLHNSEVVILQRLVDISVEFRLHNVANGVVTCDIQVSLRSEFEVFPNHSNVRVVALEMHHVINGL